jgi:hypothetical protein
MSFAYPSAAKDRGWFTDYTPIRCKAHGRNLQAQLDPGAVLNVHGFGTVELRLRQNPHNPHLFRTVFLEGVLHIPQLRCNIVCYERLKTDLGPDLASTTTSMELCSEGLSDFPNGRVLLKRLTDGNTITMTWAYFQKIQQPEPPQGQEPRERSQPCLLQLAREQPRAYTFGESRFQRMLVNSENWFEWIILPPQQQAHLEAFGKSAAGSSGWRPRTRVAP